MMKKAQVTMKMISLVLAVGVFLLLLMNINAVKNALGDFGDSIGLVKKCDQTGVSKDEYTQYISQDIDNFEINPAVLDRLFSNYFESKECFPDVPVISSRYDALMQKIILDVLSSNDFNLKYKYEASLLGVQYYKGIMNKDNLFSVVDAFATGGLVYCDDGIKIIQYYTTLGDNSGLSKVAMGECYYLNRDYNTAFGYYFDVISNPDLLVYNKYKEYAYIRFKKLCTYESILNLYEEECNYKTDDFLKVQDDKNIVTLEQYYNEFKKITDCDKGEIFVNRIEERYPLNQYDYLINEKLGECYYKSKNYDKALLYLKKVYDLKTISLSFKNKVDLISANIYSTLKKNCDSGYSVFSSTQINLKKCLSYQQSFSTKCYYKDVSYGRDKCLPCSKDITCSDYGVEACLINNCGDLHCTLKNGLCVEEI